MKELLDWQETNAEPGLPLVSIIVPVYQVKDYLGECVESLLAQTYKNLDILLVDDGSTDGSGAICDEYAAKDGRVRVVHQENQGLSAARNTGIGIAKGEYLAFVDSDDVVMPEFIETLYELLEKYQADIAACGYIKCPTEDLGRVRNEFSYADARIGGNVSADHGPTARRSQAEREELCMTAEQMLRQWHGKYKKWETVAWNKLYRGQIFEGKREADVVRFPLGRRHEDVLTSHLFAANAERVAITTKKLYLYRERPGSITDRRAMMGFRSENLRAQRERMAFFKERRYWRAYLNLWVGYVLHLGWFGWKRITGNR